MIAFDSSLISVIVNDMGTSSQIDSDVLHM